MTYFTNHSEHPNSFQTQIEMEMLEALLVCNDEDIEYPWNPADIESEDFFNAAEVKLTNSQPCNFNSFLDAELPELSQAFHNRLDTLWEKMAPLQCNMNVVPSVSLKESLQNAIASRIPQNLIDRIAEKATEIFNPKQSMGDQLLALGQALMPSWGMEDLMVLTRPLAHAMRSREGQKQNLDSVLNKIGQHEWNNLSEIEQARVSLAVAHYALKQLNETKSKEESEDI